MSAFLSLGTRLISWARSHKEAMFKAQSAFGGGGVGTDVPMGQFSSAEP